MKTILLFLSLVCVSTIGMAQVWAPAGATWHYDYVNFWVTGYVEIQYTADTTIAGKSCKILTKKLHSYDFIQHTYSTSLIGYEYTYEENNVVYYYRYGQFFKLYDFNAMPGGSWVIAGWNSPQPCDSTAVVDVDSTGLTTINSVSLKVLKISPEQNATWAFSSDSILERIGSLGYMFPEPACVVDLFEGGALRCYYDNSFGLYERGAAPNCEYITGIDKILPGNNNVKIYPVPVTSTLTIEMNKIKRGVVVIELSDLYGTQLRHFETEKPEFRFDISDLKDGIYFISITDQAGNSWNRKIIKNRRQ